jgi:peptide/nickel transport system substrate-binding protein
LKCVYLAGMKQPTKLRRYSTIFTVFVGLFYTLFIGASCTAPDHSVDRRVFRYNQEGGISSLDPAFARDQANIRAVAQLFSTLVSVDENLNVQPQLSTHWEIMDQGKLYRFFLRRDVLFHQDPCFQGTSGRKLTAHDVVFSLRRLCEPSLASPGAWIFQGKLAGDGFYAPNDSVFELRLIRPFPPILGMLGMAYCSIVAKEAVACYGQSMGIHPVGSGPFQLAYYRPGDGLILHKNPRYFEVENGKRLPWLEAVHIKFLADKQSAFLAFLSGELEFLNGVEPAFRDELFLKNNELRSDYGERFKVVRAPYLNTEYLGILNDNQLKACHPALQDPLVRKALSLAINREKLVRYLRGGIGIPAYGGLIPPGLPGSIDPSSKPISTYSTGSAPHDKKRTPSEAVEQARQILKEKGYINGSIRFTLATNPSYMDMAVFVQDQLAQIGVVVDLEASPGPTLRQMINKGERGVFRGSWIADYPDAENYLALGYSGYAAPNGPNYTRFAHPQYDAWYEQALETTDEHLRYRLYERMDSMLLAETPFIVLYYDQTLRLEQKYVHGLPAHPLDLLDLRRVRYQNKTS